MSTFTSVAPRLVRAALVLASGCTWLVVAVTVAPPRAVTAQSALPDRYRYEFGSWQDPAGTMAAPGGLTFASDGTLYVFDGDNGRLQGFDPEGRLLAAWGREGRASGQFMPSSLARPVVAADGTLFVNDQVANRISHFGRDGTYLGSWQFGDNDSRGLTHVVDLALAPDGSLWALDGSLLARTRRYTVQGQVVGHLGEIPNYVPGGAKRITVAHDGAIFVIFCTIDLIRYAPDGTFEQIIAGMSSDQPDPWVGWFFTDVDTADDGSLYVLSEKLGLTSRVDHMTRAGVILGTWPVPQTTRPDGTVVAPSDLVVAPDGTIYVADTGGGRLLHFTADGQALGSLGAASGRDARRIRAIADLAVVGDQVLALDGDGDPAVRVFTTDGAYVGAWGRPGAVDGTVSTPLAIAAAPDGSVLVADNAGRVQRFTTEGQYLARIGKAGDGPGGLTAPSAVAVAPDGTIYVADGRFASRFGKLGEFLNTFDLYQFDVSAAMAVAPDSTLLVAENVPGLRRFQADGTPLASWGEDLPFFSPNDVAVGRDGRVYAADSGERSIHVFDRNGRLLGVIQVDHPRYGSRIAPLRVDVDDSDGRLFVAPTWTQGVQVLGPSPDATWRLTTHSDHWVGGRPLSLALLAVPEARWDRGALASDRPVRGFSAVLDRNVALPPAVYAFHATATGGVRLWVGQQLLVDDWSARTTDVAVIVPIFARDTYVRLQYADNADATTTDPAAVRLTWAVTANLAHNYLPVVSK